MQQIADAAGVSRMAVSLALRNSPKISKATAERIRNIADELGYRPNPMVSALMTQLRHGREVRKPSVLAYVTAFPTENGWRQPGPQVAFHEGAKQRALQLGYILEEWWLRRAGMTERRFCEILHARNIHGMIVAPLPTDSAPLELEWAKFASATISYSLSTPSLNRASCDYFGSIQLALKEMTALGYRRIGLAIVEDCDQRVQQHWTAGMLSYQQHLPLADRVPTLLGRATGSRTFVDWFHEHQPHAVLSIGGECVRILHELGLRIPQDVGFANLALLPGQPDMAGVNQNAEHVGAAAVDLLDGQLRRNERGIPRLSRTLLIPGEWSLGPTVRDLRIAPPRARVRI
jgi:LacI family transcriptional regulator